MGEIFVWKLLIREIKFREICPFWPSHPRKQISFPKRCTTWDSKT